MKSAFESVTVFILSSNENELLRETVSKIYESVNPKDLDKTVIVAKNNRCTAYHTAVSLLESGKYKNLEIYIQKSPDAATCLAELPPMAGGSHFIIMSADMENDPNTVAKLAEMSKRNPDAIICAAKWVKGSVIEDYGFFRKICSKAVNDFAAILFGMNAKEPFSLFQIYPVCIYENTVYGKDSDFFYEYTLKPLSEGVEYIEIPTVFKKRNEGKSHFGTIFMTRVALKFCFTAVRLRFRKKPTNK